MRHVFVGSALIATGCELQLGDFEIGVALDPQTIQGSPVPGPLSGAFPIPLSLDFGSKLDAQDVGPIDSIELGALTLQITSSGADWSFVDRIDVYVESTKSGTALPRVAIASVADPGAVTLLTFTVAPDVNLKPYIDEGGEVDSTGSGREPASDVTFTGNGVFAVHPL